MITSDEITDRLIAGNYKPDEVPLGAPSGEGAPAGAAADDAAAAAAAAAAGTPQAINYEEITKGKFKTQEEFDAHLASYDDFTAKQKRVNEALDWGENPIPFDDIRSRVAFMRKSGISDESVASRVINTSDEQIAKDPALAIAISKVINNPALLTSGLTFDGVLSGIREEYGYRGEEDGVAQYDKPDMLRLNSSEAVQKIKQTKEEFAQAPDIFAQRKLDQEAHAKKVEEAQVAWQVPDTLQKIGPLKYVAKVGGKSLEVPGGTDTITQQLVSEFVKKGILPDEQGIQQFNEARENMFLLTNKELIFATLLDRGSEEMKQASNKFFHNGGPINRGQEGGAGGGNSRDQAYNDQTDRLLKG